MGYTPYTLQYQVSEDDRKRGTKHLQGTSVKWASGASANVPSLTADMNQFGFSQQFTFQRPDIPGRETDLLFALELQKLAVMRRQAQTQHDQAYYQLLQATKPVVRPTTNCTSRVIGNAVQTNCY
ncbi:MAG: hypothetical protein IPF94_16470 [Betaproteobacteria bacterium]|nr:hypothetical protein [Betaproteobacteria bacterium]